MHRGAAGQDRHVATLPHQFGLARAEQAVRMPQIGQRHPAEPQIVRPVMPGGPFHRLGDSASVSRGDDDAVQGPQPGEIL